MSASRRRAVVLGAGISGLAAARALHDRGYETDVIESCPSIGGLTRTVNVGDFCFDYTGHLLHLSRCGSPSEVPYANLRDEDWRRIDRKSFCYFSGKLITAPIQYHFGELPCDILRACVESYNNRPLQSDSDNVSFRDFIVSGFGQYLADVFLIPLNEKTLATSLDRLSIKAVKRFFPQPDEHRVRAGIENNAPSPPEYNSFFWYPRVGGMQLLVDGLSYGLNDISVLEEVTEVDLPGRRVITSNGRTWNWHLMFSSIPLKTLCAMTHDEYLQGWAKELTHSSTISINLGVCGALSPELREVHWIYVADRSLPFYRVGFYSNISPRMCPPNSASLYVEVGVPGEEVGSVDVAGNLKPGVLRALSDLGWLKVNSIRCSVTHVIRYAYIHHTPGRDTAVENIIKYLENHDIFPVGRYGLWDYISMEDSIFSAISAVQRVVS